MCQGKFIAPNAYIQEEEKPEINHRNLYLKKMEKEKQIKSKVGKNRGNHYLPLNFTVNLKLV